MVHGAEVFHPARIEDLEEEGLLHLAHLGPVLGVERQGEACSRIGAAELAQLVGCDLDAEFLPCPGGEISEPARVRLGGGPTITRRRTVGGVELLVEGIPEGVAVVLLTSDLAEDGFDLGPHEGAEFLGIDDGVEAVAGPLREAISVVSGGGILPAFGEEPGESDLDGELGFLAGIKGENLGAESVQDLGLGELVPALDIDGDAELVVEPAGE